MQSNNPLGFIIGVLALCWGLTHLTRNNQQTAEVLEKALATLEKFKESDPKPEVPDPVPDMPWVPPGPPAPVDDVRKPEPAKEEAPKPEPPKPVKRLTMHTAEWCGFCTIDKREIIPKWIEAGYNVDYVDHTDFRKNRSPYNLPWYEIDDGTGQKLRFIGSLKFYRKDP